MMYGRSLSILALLTVLPATATGNEASKADAIMVYKAERVLMLLQRGEILAQYPISLGADPTGHKVREGDRRTPEGRYFIDWRNPISRFYKSLHISYPNQLDLINSQLAGTHPGGMVMIHGMPSAPELRWMHTQGDWTDGCIAVSNEAMDEIWDAVKDGTLIIIKP
jgi:murein L,D-transpeptidase YafK